MKRGDKLKFAIKLYNKQMLCIVIPEDGKYYIQLNAIDIAAIKLNDHEKWVQLNGRQLPDEFINEVGQHIETRYREELFVDNS